jgi:hypothetical protein
MIERGKAAWATLAAFEILICIGCQSKTAASIGLLEDPLVSEVMNGAIREYPNVPIGKAFDATFDNPKWTSGESEKGVKYVEFTGHLKDSFFRSPRYVDWQKLLAVRGEQDKERLESVQFQFQFTADGKAFTLSYINPVPFLHGGVITRASTLEYVFE